MFEKALADHKAGRLKEAEAAYRQVLDANPDHADALYFMGRLRMGEGALSKARDLMVHSLDLSDDHATRHNNLGTVLQGLGDIDAAVESFRRAIEVDPGLAEAHVNLGAALHEMRDLKGAESSYKRAIELHPEHFPAFNNLAHVFRDQGNPEAAEAAALKAVELRPGEAKAHNNLGVIQHERGNNEEAFHSFKAAIECDPNYAEAYNNLGSVFRDQHQLDAAEASFRKALELNPNSGDAHNNLGSIYQRQGQLDDAETCFNKALEIDPDYPPVLANIGTVCHRRNQQDRAMAYFRRALEADPNYPEAHFNVSEVLLLAGGSLVEGWREHEWRWRKKEFVRQWRDFRSPAWDGSDLGGKAVVVWGEQGIGEEILYASMVPDLVERCAKVIFECEQRLVPVCRRSFPKATVVARETPPVSETTDPAVDFHTPAGNLGRWLRPNVDDFPKRRAFLEADPIQTGRLREKYRNAGAGPIVGVSWFSRNPEMGWDKTIDLADWAPLLTLPGVTFVDLQYGDALRQRREFEAETGVHIIHDNDVDQLKDLDAFAAQVAAMDLVVSISNTTVHMAGALGVPTWVLLSAVPLWRWFSGRGDSPWYPSLRLFRQSKSGDWETVIRQARIELENWYAENRPAPPPPLKPTELIRQIIDHYQNREFIAALEGCVQVLEAEPGNESILALASSSALETGDAQRALEFADELIALAPDKPSGYLHRGNAFLVLREADDAARAYGKAVELDSSSAEGHMGLGRALFDAGRLEDAKTAFENTIERDPDQAKVWLALGEIAQIQGRAEEAKDRFRGAVTRRPDFAKANLALSRIKAFESHGDPDLERMLELVQQNGCSDQERAHLSFALFKAFDDLGEPDRAFSHLDEGNRLFRKELDYDVGPIEHFAKRNVQVFDAEFFENRKAFGYDEADTIFLVGMPRSGSTLVEQVLAGHSAVSALGEAGGLEREILKPHPLGIGDGFPETLAEADRSTVRAIAERFSARMSELADGSGRPTNKTLMHFLYIGFIALAMPNASIVHCRRDPRDVCFSCYRQLFPGNGPAFVYDFEDLARYHRLYDGLMSYWHNVLPGRILDVEYERVVEDLEGEARRLLDFCGLEWEGACLDFHTVGRDVKTASNLQVRRPLYNSAVERWRPYERHLKPLFDLLEEDQADR